MIAICLGQGEYIRLSSTHFQNELPSPCTVVVFSQTNCSPNNCQAKLNPNVFVILCHALHESSFVEDPFRISFCGVRSCRGEKTEVLTFIERGRCTRRASGSLSVNTGWGTRRSIV